MLDYPTGVVSGRFGGSVMFVAYDRLLQRWFWVQPKGINERISEPSHIFVDEKWARKHKLKKPRPSSEKPAVNIRRKKCEAQLVLEL